VNSLGVVLDHPLSFPFISYCSFSLRVNSSCFLLVEVVNSLGVVLDGRLAQQQQQHQRPRTDTKTQTVAGKVAQRKHDHHKVKQSIQYAIKVLRIRDVYTGSDYFPSRIRIKELKYFNLTQQSVSKLSEI
jgi:hypothetical protein